MFCPNCGYKVTDGIAFCPNCGQKVEINADLQQSTSVNPSVNITKANSQQDNAYNSTYQMNYTPMETGAVGKSTKSNKKILLFVGIAVVIFLIIVAVVIGIIFTSQNASSSVAQANVENWGYAVCDGKTSYYSDAQHGIYKLDDTGHQDLFAEGNYSEMGLLDDIIICLEYSQADDGISSGCIVAINTKTREKSIVYRTDSIDTQIIGAGVVKNKYYFIIDNDTLYCIDNDLNVNNTGIRNVKKVTESGIYTTNSSEYGLNLLSFNGKVKETYTELNNYNVSVYFELGNNVYLKCVDDESSKISCMDTKAKTITAFPSEDFYEKHLSPSFCNYYNGTFYISCIDNLGDTSVEYSVFSMDEDGKNIKLICNQETNSNIPFCTLNIAGNYLIIKVPLSSNEPIKINLEDISDDNNFDLITTTSDEEQEIIINSNYLVDNADLFTDEEKRELINKIDYIRQTYDFDVIIHTTETYNGKSAMTYADDFYISGNYGYGDNKDGCVMVINISTRDWWLSTCGRGIDVISDDRIDNIGDIITPSLKNDEFFVAMVSFLDQIESYINT